MVELSVVIVTIKNEDEILCLPKFKESDFDDYEVIIRDDEGIAKARNEGVKEANADKIVFIDDDAEPMDGYLQAAANILQDEYVVAGKVIHPDNSLISVMASHYPTSDEGQYVQGVVGCNMGFKREVFETVGYFDENFLWGHEESEFVERTKKEYPVYYEPNMGVVHPYASGIIDYWKKQYRFGPSDIYRAKQKTGTDRDTIKSILDLSSHFDSDPKTWPIYAVGGVCRIAGRVRAIVSQRG